MKAWKSYKYANRVRYFNRLMREGLCTDCRRPMTEKRKARCPDCRKVRARKKNERYARMLLPKDPRLYCVCHGFYRPEGEGHILPSQAPLKRRACGGRRRSGEAV